jgi:hypothetical protein
MEIGVATALRRGWETGACAAAPQDFHRRSPNAAKVVPALDLLARSGG